MVEDKRAPSLREVPRGRSREGWGGFAGPVCPSQEQIDLGQKVQALGTVPRRSCHPSPPCVMDGERGAGAGRALLCWWQFGGKQGTEECFDWK